MENSVGIGLKDCTLTDNAFKLKENELSHYSAFKLKENELSHYSAFKLKENELSHYSAFKLKENELSHGTWSSLCLMTHCHQNRN